MSRSTHIDVTAVFHDWTYGGVVQVEGGLRREVSASPDTKQPSCREALLAMPEMYLSQPINASLNPFCLNNRYTREGVGKKKRGGRG